MLVDSDSYLNALTIDYNNLKQDNHKSPTYIIIFIASLLIVLANRLTQYPRSKINLAERNNL